MVVSGACCMMWLSQRIAMNVNTVKKNRDLYTISINIWLMEWNCYVKFENFVKSLVNAYFRIQTVSFLYYLCTRTQFCICTQYAVRICVFIQVELRHLLAFYILNSFRFLKILKILKYLNLYFVRYILC